MSAAAAAAFAGLASGAAGGIASAISASKSRKAQAKALREAMAYINGLEGDLPTYDQMAIELDPAFLAQQQAVLDRLAQQSETGYTPQDLAAQQAANERAAMADRAGRQAMMQNMSARGIHGSGLEAQAALSGASSSANRLSQIGADQAQTAQQRALQALLARGDMAGNMQNQGMATKQYNSALRNQIYANRANLTGMRTGALTNQANLAGERSNFMTGLGGSFMQGGLNSLSDAARYYQPKQSVRDDDER